MSFVRCPYCSVILPPGSLVGTVEHFRVHREGMFDVWLALGGDGITFEQMMDEPRRTPADTWAQLMAMVRGDYADLLADSNPPCGPQFEALILQSQEATDA